MVATIIGNLVRNAIKYTEKDGVLVACQRCGNELSVQVIDSGMGIEPTRQQASFDAFYQEDIRSEGLGLGLSMVLRTAHALHYRMQLHSKLNQGARFSFLIPVIQ
jgi:two-component system, sensor histidine kinase